MDEIFETKVIEIGPQAKLMIEDANMVILFGQEAPKDLAEYCFKIENKTLKGSIKAGGEFLIDDRHFPITLVGDLVERNLITLGHVTISFDGESEQTLPGTLHVQGEHPIEIGENSIIKILA